MIGRRKNTQTTKGRPQVAVGIDAGANAVVFELNGPDGEWVCTARIAPRDARSWAAMLLEEADRLDRVVKATQ